MVVKLAPNQNIRRQVPKHPGPSPSFLVHLDVGLPIREDGPVCFAGACGCFVGLGGPVPCALGAGHAEAGVPVDKGFVGSAVELGMGDLSVDVKGGRG